MTTATALATGLSFCKERGGTFTDVIGRSPDGAVQTLKLLPSSPPRRQHPRRASRHDLHTLRSVSSAHS